MSPQKIQWVPIVVPEYTGLSFAASDVPISSSDEMFRCFRQGIKVLLYGVYGWIRQIQLESGDKTQGGRGGYYNWNVTILAATTGKYVTHYVKMLS